MRSESEIRKALSFARYNFRASNNSEARSVYAGWINVFRFVLGELPDDGAERINLIEKMIAQQIGQSDHGTAAEPAGKRPSTAAKGSAKAVRGRNSPVGRGVTKIKSRGKE